MGNLKDIYDILKDSVKTLKDLAKKAKNQEMIDLAIEIQDKIFEIKDEMQNLKEINMDLNNELKQSKQEVDKLQKILEDYELIKSKLIQYEKNDDALGFYDTEVVLDFTEIHYFFTSDTVIHKTKLNLTLDKIFKVISLKMMSPISQKDFLNSFTSLCEGYYVDEKQALQVKAQFLALGLIEVTTNKKDEEIIRLTPKGFKEMQKLNTIKQGE